jgi:signal transduction histidine kinase
MKIFSHPRKPEPAPAADQRPDFFRELQIEFLIHELKGPVAVIETGVRTLLERQDKLGPLSPRQEKTLKRVLRNTRKTRQMMNSLLEIGRSQAGCFACAAFDPALVTTETLLEALEISQANMADQIPRQTDRAQLTAFLEANGVHLGIDPEVKTSQLIQDETKFRQTLGNLIRNALYHRRKTITINLHQQGDNLVIEVSDDGPGIAPEHHELVFKRYTQIKTDDALKRRGHGLGLAGALVLARSMGGNIQLESRKGCGATFRLILPCTLATEESTEEER